MRSLVRSSQIIRFAQGGNAAGATLIEVLMSLMIMGVGITSVIALFPLSMLSSIRATQMTNGKLLEQNVVDLIRTYPQMVEGFPQWQPGFNYVAPDNATTKRPPENSRISAVPAPGRFLSSSNYFYIASAGTSGTVEPSWNIGTTNDNGITWTASKPADLVYGPDSSLAAPLRRTTYVVDPIGYWNSTDSDGNNWNPFSSSGVRTCFGADSAGTSAYTSGATKSLPRLTANLSSDVADKLFALPDSWQLISEAIPTGLSQNTMSGIWTVTLPSPSDFTSLAGSAAGAARITFLSTDGTRSATRDLNVATAAKTTTSTTCELAANNSLPSDLDELVPSEIGKVRVEAFSRRYSFLLTVIRNPDGTAKVQCPIYFNRSFSGQDERAFAATVDSQDTFVVDLTGASPIPLIVEGHFTYDVVNAQWYKIVSTTGSGTSRTVTLDRSIVDPMAVGSTGLMFPTGVVNVFDIEL